MQNPGVQVPGHGGRGHAMTWDQLPAHRRQAVAVHLRSQAAGLRQSVGAMSRPRRGQGDNHRQWLAACTDLAEGLELGAQELEKNRGLR